MSGYTVSAKHRASDFEAHRFSIGGPYPTLDEARQAKAAAERDGYEAVRIYAVGDDD